MRVAAPYGVGPQEGGADQGGGGRLDAVDDAQHLEFVHGVEAVPALDLDGAGTLGNHLVHARHGLPEEFIFGGLVQQVGGVEDAAAPGRDLFVGKPPDLVEEFPVPAAGIDDVGVAVAESRHQQAAAAVDDFLGPIARHIVARAGAVASVVENPAVFDPQPGVVDRPDLVHRRAFFAQDACRHDACKRSDVGEQPSHLTDTVFRG